jgi:glucosamine 6-phosphate synthetase-like amidotransferase/phosphosugar isomerase protein
VVGDFGAHRLVIAEPGIDVSGYADHATTVAGRLDWLIAGVAFLTPLQLLAYHWTRARGMNPDRPTFSDAMLRAMLPTGRNEPDWEA